MAGTGDGRWYAREYLKLQNKLGGGQFFLGVNFTEIFEDKYTFYTATDKFWSRIQSLDIFLI